MNDDVLGVKPATTNKQRHDFCDNYIILITKIEAIVCFEASAANTKLLWYLWKIF